MLTKSVLALAFLGFLFSKFFICDSQQRCSPLLARNIFCFGWSNMLGDRLPFLSTRLFSLFFFWISSTRSSPSSKCRLDFRLNLLLFLVGLMQPSPMRMNRSCRSLAWATLLAYPPPLPQFLKVLGAEGYVLRVSLLFLCYIKGTETMLGWVDILRVLVGSSLKRLIQGRTIFLGDSCKWSMLTMWQEEGSSTKENIPNQLNKCSEDCFMGIVRRIAIRLITGQKSKQTYYIDGGILTIILFMQLVQTGIVFIRSITHIKMWPVLAFCPSNINQAQFGKQDHFQKHIALMYYEKNSHYGKIEFWEKRYAENPNIFDWYQNWGTLRDIISQYTTHGNQILNVGAGNSALSEQMYKEGYQNITNIDFSTIVIEDMQLRYATLGYQKSFQYLCCDVRDMSELEDEHYDVVIDKGTLDSVLCGAYSSQNCKKMFREISRVLKTKGYYICISYGDPDIRRSYFEHEEYEWSIMSPSPYKVFKPNISQNDVEFDDKDKEKNKDYYHYIYVLQKRADTMTPLTSQAKVSNPTLKS